MAAARQAASSGLGSAGQISEKERAEALAQIDLVKIGRAYILAMIEETPGYKAFLVDKETLRVCSTLYGRGEFAEHSVVQIERLDQNDGKQHKELKVGRVGCRVDQGYLCCWNTYMVTTGGRAL